MKKNLLYACTILCTFSLSNAQSIINDNFNLLTIGNIGTDATGVTAGQGGYYTAGGTNSDYQIVADVPSQGNVIQMTGSATATGNKFLAKVVSAAWAARTVGNNIFNVEFDFYTGPATTSKNTARCYIYNSNGLALAGFTFNLETKVLSGIAYYDNAGDLDSYSFFLGDGGTSLTLPADTWVRIGVSYDTVTREVVWKGPGFYGGVPGALPATGTNTPSEIDFIHAAGTSNTVSATSKFDNLVARASLLEDLLGKSDFNSVKLGFANVSPNPVVDFASINLIDAQINAITVMDINGRVIKTGNSNELLNAKIDLSDLTAGIYLMTIDTDKGVSTEKIVKK
jgi:hypothetical protein